VFKPEGIAGVFQDVGLRRRRPRPAPAPAE
jgi:hypothetical protein